MEKRWADCLADITLLTETTKTILETPYDPDFRQKAGEICLRNHRVADGLKWLDSALAIRPDHAGTHAVLARHYRAIGDTRQAEYHRRRAEPPQPPKK